MSKEPRSVALWQRGINSEILTWFLCSLFQLLESEQQVAQLQETVKELEATLETTRSQLQDKDTQLEEQKRRERDLLTTITEYVQNTPFLLCKHIFIYPHNGFLSSSSPACSSVCSRASRTEPDFPVWILRNFEGKTTLWETSSKDLKRFVWSSADKDVDLVVQSILDASLTWRNLNLFKNVKISILFILTCDATLESAE